MSTVLVFALGAFAIPPSMQSQAWERSFVSFSVRPVEDMLGGCDDGATIVCYGGVMAAQRFVLVCVG